MKYIYRPGSIKNDKEKVQLEQIFNDTHEVMNPVAKTTECVIVFPNVRP